jgi:hypothetical protein
MLEKLLSQKKEAIIKGWHKQILNVYPSDYQKLLKREKDRFANPVGSAISEGIEGLFEALLHKFDTDTCNIYLDKIIRIKAVQDFSPAGAVDFIFLLKKVVRTELKAEIRQNDLFDELLEFESKIDMLALLAFNIYLQCREKLYELRVNEFKRMTSNLLRKANLTTDISEENLESEFKNTN